MACKTTLVEVDGEHKPLVDDRPNYPTPILTDAEWNDVLVVLGIASLSSRERFDLDAINLSNMTAPRSTRLKQL
jgi:hypothetical protein